MHTTKRIFDATDTRFDSPATFISKGNALDWASLRYLKDISNDVNSLLAQQQAEMFDVKDGTQKLKDTSPSLLKQLQLDAHNKENITKGGHRLNQTVGSDE